MNKDVNLINYARRALSLAISYQLGHLEAVLAPELSGTAKPLTNLFSGCASVRAASSLPLKETDLSVYSQEQLDAIADQINNRPRKRLGVISPLAVCTEMPQYSLQHLALIH